MNEHDIYVAANFLVNRFGHNAVAQAAARSNEFTNAGDPDGARVWLRIIKAIDEIQRQTPAWHERVH